MTPEERQALREQSEKAEKLPWYVSELTVLGQGDFEIATTVTSDYAEISEVGPASIPIWTQDKAHVAYIVAACNAVPALLDQIEALERERDVAQFTADVRGNMLRYISFTAGGSESADPQLSVDRLKAERDCLRAAAGYSDDELRHVFDDALVKLSGEVGRQARGLVRVAEGERDDAYNRLREVSVVLSDAGVPGGTTLVGGVTWLRERAERAEDERDTLGAENARLREALADVQAKARAWHVAGNPGKWECANEIEPVIEAALASRPREGAE